LPSPTTTRSSATVLRRLLESEPGFEVVAEANDGMDAIRMAHDAHPDVLLLDVAMPRMGGLDTLAALANDGPRVILLTPRFRLPIC
jgi:chemotaxis response regulator CheB